MAEYLSRPSTLHVRGVLKGFWAVHLLKLQRSIWQPQVLAKVLASD